MFFGLKRFCENGAIFPDPVLPLFGGKEWRTTTADTKSTNRAALLKTES